MIATKLNQKHCKTKFTAVTRALEKARKVMIREHGNTASEKELFVAQGYLNLSDVRLKQLVGELEYHAFEIQSEIFRHGSKVREIKFQTVARKET